YYNRAHNVKALLRKDFDTAFQHVDVILTPTSPTPAFKIGERASNPLSMYLADIFTVSANLTSLPAISIPSGTTEREGKHLPLGIQFTAPYAQDDVLFAIGKLFEQSR
ncbi:MAG: amidase family protein, partial [bacterium]|nr:amidase family protein [bacterium]